MINTSDKALMGKTEWLIDSKIITMNKDRSIENASLSETLVLSLR